MTDHEHDHHHTIVLEESESITTPKSGEAPERIIAGSILLAAVLVCASIFYNTSLIVKSLGGTGGIVSGQQGTGAGNQQAAAPSPQAPSPTAPVTVADRANEPTLGNKNAKVTIVEFEDFQCPFCKSFFDQTLSQLKKDYVDTGKVKLIFRHFPLTQIHVNAQISAVAAECANNQGKFWEYHDILFKNSMADGTNLDKASLKKYADQLGLNNGTLGFNKNQFNQCLDNSSTLDIVNKDQAEGTKDGVTGTPSFFINGKLLVGAQPYPQFQTAIDAALK